LEHHPAVSVGAVYDVVSIECVPGDDPSVLIYTEEDGPSWWNIRMFTCVSPDIFANWQISIRDDGTLDIGPAQLNAPGFLEDLYEGDAESRRIFEDEFLRYRIT
jgi:hypothetical protein